MDVRNIRLDGFTFTGGDDCIAIKPRSYGVHISNVTCNGGNGVAIGSLGQYLEDSSVEDVVIEDVRVWLSPFLFFPFFCLSRETVCGRRGQIYRERERRYAVLTSFADRLWTPASAHI
jgi:hypothetical protein